MWSPSEENLECGNGRQTRTLPLPPLLHCHRPLLPRAVDSHHTWPGGAKPKLCAVAALLQQDTSAIVTLASSGIDRPAKLQGRR